MSTSQQTLMKTADLLTVLQTHFLLNSLSAVYHYLDIDPQVAKRFLELTTDTLINALLSLEEQSLVPFNEVLHALKTYLNMERARLHPRLKIIYHIDTTAFMMPPLCLQLIAEHAIMNGMRDRQQTYHLTIHTYETDEQIIIDIIDDGVYNHLQESLLSLNYVERQIDEMAHGTIAYYPQEPAGLLVQVILPKNISHNETGI